MLKYGHGQRLDWILSWSTRGLAESRTLAQRLVMAGQVRVDGQVVDQARPQKLPGCAAEVDLGPRFVSRGGEKLAAALTAFHLSVGWSARMWALRPAGSAIACCRTARQSLRHRCGQGHPALETAPGPARGGHGKHQCPVPGARCPNRSTW